MAVSLSARWGKTVLPKHSDEGAWGSCIARLMRCNLSITSVLAMAYQYHRP